MVRVGWWLHLGRLNVFRGLCKITGRKTAPGGGFISSHSGGGGGELWVWRAAPGLPRSLPEPFQQGAVSQNEVHWSGGYQRFFQGSGINWAVLFVSTLMVSKSPGPSLRADTVHIMDFSRHRSMRRMKLRAQPGSPLRPLMMLYVRLLCMTPSSTKFPPPSVGANRAEVEVMIWLGLVATGTGGWISHVVKPSGSVVTGASAQI